MKNKIKKLKLPLSKMTGAEKDYTAVLLEDVNSNMKAFWEVLSGTQADVKELKSDVSEMKEDINGLKIDVSELKEKTGAIEIKLDGLIEEVSFIKEEIKSLRMFLSEKADKEKLERLEMRVIRIEKNLNLSR
ncbi:MAG: hypothetical protein AAB962_00725 [Patescibacteria group bacterium]